MADLLPFILLAIALGAFLFSTRQMGVMLRWAVWLAGVALLTATAIMSLSGPVVPGVFQAVVDLVFGQLGGEVLVTAIDGNFPTVDTAIAPMFGIFFFLTIVVAIVSLIAFTPGETIERFIRPVNVLFIGAIAGAIAALVVAGIGFGELRKRHVFINVVAAGDIVDGDGFRMGEVSLRLWGIDAPERRAEQVCRRDDQARTPFKCGEDAAIALSALTAGKLVICQKPKDAGETQDPGPPDESYGRPIVSCWTGGKGDRLYLAAEMVRMGHAEPYRLDDQDDPSRNLILQGVTEAKANKAGIWNGWRLSPEDWRDNKPCREWFMAPDWKPSTPAGSVETCPSRFLPAPANDNPPPATTTPAAAAAAPI
jgi:endonuclease YncB( thermonuclease family)